MSNENVIPVDEITVFLNENFSNYCTVLKEMVEINSYTENKNGVDKLGYYTENLFGKFGFTAQRYQSVNPKYGDHLFLEKKGSGKRSLCCVSHLDTVFPREEEKINDFIYHIQGDRVYGPGTNDVKGGTVILFMVLQCMHHFMPEVFDAVTWQLFLDASEETDSEDFTEICRSRFSDNTAACLIFEGGSHVGNEFTLVTSRKGRAVFRVKAVGRSAHSGVDHGAGVNAIVQLAEVVAKIDAVTDYSRDLTVNIGVINGGGQVNRVPGEAYFDVEVRAFSPDILQHGIDSIKSFNGYSSIGSKDGNFKSKIEVNLLHQCPAWPKNDMSEGLLFLYQSAAEKMNCKVSREERGGLSDGNYLWDAVPVIDGLGPAGENAHCSERLPDGSKDQEYALLSSFIPKTVLNIHAIAELVKG